MNFQDVKTGDILKHPAGHSVKVVSKASTFIELRHTDAPDHPTHSEHLYPSEFEAHGFEKHDAAPAPKE